MEKILNMRNYLTVLTKVCRSTVTLLIHLFGSAVGLILAIIYQMCSSNCSCTAKPIANQFIPLYELRLCLSLYSFRLLFP